MALGIARGKVHELIDSSITSVKRTSTEINLLDYLLLITAQEQHF